MDGLSINVVHSAKLPIRVNEATLAFINDRRICTDNAKDRRNARFLRIPQLTCPIPLGGWFEKSWYNMCHSL